MERGRRGRVLSIQRMSTEDGPGIRTTVFLKGCPLRCAWCHNPESLRAEPEVVVQPSRCMGCGACREVCPQETDPSRCTACGRCVDACPPGARERQGVSWEAEALAREAARDQAFFAASGGGVTLSGGEPAMQAPFVRAVAETLGSLGIPVALDTSGAVPTEVLWMALEPASLVLFDVKIRDREAHRRWTGRDNDQVLQNLHQVVQWRRQGRWNGTVWVRTPLIPGATDDEANLRGIGRLLADLGEDVVRWDLCPFNPLCRDQYRRRGQTWAFDEESFQSPERLEELAAMARDSGVRPEVVRVGGRAAQGA